jgi:hypothetical protein
LIFHLPPRFRTFTTKIPQRLISLLKSSGC